MMYGFANEIGTACDDDGVRHYMLAFGSRWTMACSPGGVWSRWHRSYPIGSLAYFDCPVTCVLCIAEQEP